MPQTRSSHQHATNVLGALSLVVADRMNAAAGALAAMHEFLDGGSVTQFSSVLGPSHSGTVRLVDRLAVEGLVERIGAKDGRAVSVVLTSSGRPVALRIRQARSKSLTSALFALTSDEVDNLVAALDTTLIIITITIARADERSAHNHDRLQPWLCRLCDFAACGRSEGNCLVNNAVADSNQR